MYPIQDADYFASGGVSSNKQGGKKKVTVLSCPFLNFIGQAYLPLSRYKKLMRITPKITARVKVYAHEWLSSAQIKRMGTSAHAVVYLE